MHGRTPSSADEAVVVGSMKFCPWSTEIAIGTVCFELDTSMINGRKNSFHVQMKENAKKTYRDGLLMGATIRTSSWSLEQPSTRAASRISRGNCRRTDVIR